MKAFCFLLIVLCMAPPPLGAQTATDPLSGRWSGNWGPTPSHRHAVTLELKWDGKTLKGTINPGPNSFRLQKTSFDSNTGAVRMEVDAGTMGKRFHYVIEGRVEDGILIGTWHHAKLKGDFKVGKR